MNKHHREEESIVDVLNKLKDQLSDFNFVNIGNLTALTNNIQFLFSYVKNALLAILYHKDSIQGKLQRLQLKIKQNNLAYLLQGEEADNTNHRLLLLNQKMRNAMFKKQPSIHGERGKRSELSNSSVKSTTSRQQEKQKTRYQYNMAISFVKQFLKNKMEDEPTKSIELPKNSILNLYLEWSQKNRSPIQYRFLSSIQMALTNEIKKHFPKSFHNSRSFKGIKFKEQYKNLMKTDVKLRREMRENEVAEQSEQQQQSPPLPTFEDDYKVQNDKM